MTRTEWSPGDGCGKCCLHKLEDETDGELHTPGGMSLSRNRNNAAVRYLPNAKSLSQLAWSGPGKLDNLYFMPSTCAYRVLAEGKALPIWHPLIAGDRKAMIASDITITGKVVSDEFVHEDGFEEHIVHWVK